MLRPNSTHAGGERPRFRDIILHETINWFRRVLRPNSTQASGERPRFRGIILYETINRFRRALALTIGLRQRLFTGLSGRGAGRRWYEKAGHSAGSRIVAPKRRTL